jgi:SAM-dependent methyltransferase
MHCSWEQPGLIIRPGLADIIDPMIALDPLYIMDENLLLLDHVKSLWNEIYQSRIRYGIIDDQSNDIFKNLPKSQFGFVLVNDFFNYKPFDIIKKYTQEIYGLLKPGGSMIFTYNNCDYANAVRNFENLLYTYTPGSLIIKMLEFIGFEVTTTFSDSNDNTNWIEVKKPGKLSTLRGGQCLGKINI